MNLRNQAGLTLIEVAIVIAIVGILLIPTLSVYGIYRTDQIKRESDDRLNTIENALQRYAIRTGRYPIPAHRNIEPDNINFGREASTAGLPACSINIATACRITNVDPVYRRGDSWHLDPTCTDVDPECTQVPNEWGNILVGDLPIAELGMPINFMTDGYGGKFTYAVTEAQTNPNNFLVAGAYSPTNFEESGYLRVVRDDGGDVDGTNSDIHFVVFSHGEDQRGAFSISGNLIRSCGTSAEGRGFTNCNLNDRIFTDNTGEIGVAPNIITTSYHVKRPGVDYFDDYVGYANTVTSEIWTRTISTVANTDIFSRTLGNIRLGANGALDNPPHPMAKVEVHGNMRIDGRDTNGDGTPDEIPTLYAGRLCAPRVDVPGVDTPLLTTNPQFDDYGYDLFNQGSERFVIADTSPALPGTVVNQIYWPRRNSDGTLFLPLQIDPARPIFIDNECPIPGDVAGLTNPWPAGVFTPEIIIKPASPADAGNPGGGILCEEGDAMKGWQNVDERCEQVRYNGAAIGNPCEITDGEYSSGIIGGQFTCHTN